MTVKKAESVLEKKGFKFETKSEASKDVKKGRVIRTNPKAGSSKRRGSVITIVESTGEEDVLLEDYTNQNVSIVKERLEKLGLVVSVEKKEVDNPKDYVGKDDVVIEQEPKYVADEKKELKSGSKIVLYMADIYSEYPKMVDENWSLSKVEEFTSLYGLTLVVKDKKGNTISDYSSYLDKIIVSQNRTGKIASGVTFTVTIDVDMTTYNLVINYVDQDGKAVKDTKNESHKNGDSGNVSCPLITGYTVDKASIPYKIDGKDVTVDCKYTKDKEESTNNNSNND